MLKRLPLVSLLLLSVSCSSNPPSTMAEFPELNTDRMLKDIVKLSSDEFEGRQPGSKGEELTVAYLTEELKNMGLEPGNPDGSWTQKAALVGLTPQPTTGFVVKKGAATKEFNINRDVVVMSKHVSEDV